MRNATLGAFFALLLSGQVFAIEELVRHVNITEGASHPFSVVTLLHQDVEKCILEPPHSDIIEFEPNNVSQSTDRFEVLLGDILSQCQLRVHNIGKDDQGIWTMYYEHAGGKGDSQRYNVTVLSEDVLTTEASVFEGSTELGTIEHFTRKGSLIDISLPKEYFEEECFIVSPTNNMTAADIPLHGVKVQSSSEFVSCRITIGPMEDNLIGQWGVCGKSKTTGSMRCQPATIAWNSDIHKDAYWEKWDHVIFNHVVHVGGFINPGVSSSGNVITCHAVTPDGEDLVLTSDTHYPNVERVFSEDTGLCSVIIRVADLRSLGKWTVYGKFWTFGALYEESLPMDLTLYNELDPTEQAYNVTMLSSVNHVVNLGTQRVEVEVGMEVTDSSQINDCQITAPSGHKFNRDSAAESKHGVSFVNVNDKVACRVAIGPITEEMVGQWQFIGKFNHSNLFDEKVKFFNIIIEDPANPIEDVDRVIRDLSNQRIETSMKTQHNITIPTIQSVTGASCVLRTPNGLQYTLMEGFNVDGVKIINEPGVQCGVTIDLEFEDLIGEWVLMARGVQLFQATEWRLNFTIYVEEQVTATPQQANIAAGNDLYLRLVETTSLYETCNLIRPDGSVATPNKDAAYINSCGYIIKDVSEDDTGKWMIVYGDKIIYRAVIHVNVFVPSAVSAEDQMWTLGTPVNTTIGPEDVVYCKLQDGNGLTMFDSFGRCVIDIKRVTMDHEGVWTMSANMMGTVLLQKTTFIVNVNQAVSTPVVTTSVRRVEPSVMLTCSVPSEYEVKGCKFRDHRGDVMVVHQGVGQEVKTGAVVTSFESEMSANNCTLRLTNPTAADLGLWRCAVETQDEILYAFATVTCPWLMQNPEVAASVVLEPKLTQEKTDIVSLEGDSTVMSCAIDASIRYCYFRASNGSIFNLRPGLSTSNFEYIGAGFHAGDCGIRFTNLLATDSGRWSCHVGLFDTSTEEQRAQFDVEVREKMTVSHYRSSNGGLVLEGAVYNNHRVEYCRYVRIDGLGFTSDNVPAGYTVDNVLMANGYCTLWMDEPTMLNLHPWTVIAKLDGVDQEIAKSSDDHLMVESPVNAGGTGNNGFSVTLLWMSFGFIFLSVAMLGSALIPKNNRRWTFARVSKLRNSIRKVPREPTQNTTRSV